MTDRPTGLKNASYIAEYLDVSVQSVMRMARKKQIPSIRIGTSVRFDLDEVLASLKNESVNA